MGRSRRRIPLPPEDVCDTMEEVDAYYDAIDDFYATRDSNITPDEPY